MGAVAVFFVNFGSHHPLLNGKESEGRNIVNKNTVFERCTAKRKKLPSTTKGNELRKDVEQLKPNLKLISMNEIQTEEVAWL